MLAGWKQRVRALKKKDVRAWERSDGRVPESAFVAMRTGWSKRWPDMAAMENKDADGIAHFPGELRNSYV